jgi:hypothetical protein
MTVKSLVRAVRDLEKIKINSFSEKWDHSETVQVTPEALAKELEEEKPLLDHLDEKHVWPIFKWKLKVGLEKRHERAGPGYFSKYGQDFQNPTIEEYEYFRLLRKQHEAIGYDLGKDPNYQF